MAPAKAMDVPGCRVGARCGGASGFLEGAAGPIRDVGRRHQYLRQPEPWRIELEPDRLDVHGHKVRDVLRAAELADALDNLCVLRAQSVGISRRELAPAPGEYGVGLFLDFAMLEPVCPSSPVRLWKDRCQ